MSNTFLLPIWVLYIIMFLFLSMSGLLYFIFKKYVSLLSSDKVILIDKENRWQLHDIESKGKDKITLMKKDYILTPECSLLNQKGKSLHIFSENVAAPMNIAYKKSEWLDAESLKAIMNNKLVQMIVQPRDSAKDMLIMYGAIGGIIAGVASIVIILKTAGVF